MFSFCCLGGGVFFFFFSVWAGACFFFAVRAGPGPPPKQQKKKTRPRPNSKKKSTRKAQTTKKTRQQKNKHSYQMGSCKRGHELGTAPLSNSWITIIIWLYIALNRTPDIDCFWGGGQYPSYKSCDAGSALLLRSWKDDGQCPKA